ncbi:MAG: Fur family transcriptional regulator [bacterium]
MKSLQEIIEDKGMRPSHQRLKVLEYLRDNRTHPTVDEIYQALKKSLPTISKTTIYNTLYTFIEAGLVSEITVCCQEARYDYVTQQHAHFLCKDCGAVEDIVDIKYPKIGKEVDGHQVEDMMVYVKGICSKCR